MHFTHRVGWLRAAVLGANDGIVSTASLIVGVAAAEASRGSVRVAGAMSMRQADEGKHGLETWRRAHFAERKASDLHGSVDIVPAA
jgi:VIT1/CCC1 family predicted Fe2+/Mn2+ transporter